jgi:hypothetical protein
MRLQIEPAANGMPTATFDGRYLHSRRDPAREALRAVTELIRREPPCVVLMGVGLGYHAEAILRGTETTALIAVEPDGELLAEGLSATGLSHLLEDPRFCHVATPEELAGELSLRAAAGFEQFALAARRSADEEAFEAFDKVLRSFSSRLDINQNTLRRFGRLWVRNLSKNLLFLSSGRPVSELRNRFRGIPGLLLAAGPSLDQILGNLPDLASRAVLVAVDTAVRPALNCGVEPDIAVVVDPQYWNSRHLDRLTSTRTLLVAESSTHPAGLRPFSPPHYFCASLFPLGQAIEQVLGPLGSLGTGGSVATTAWDLLRYMGVTEVFAAGLDLGFPLRRTHYRGSYFESLAVESASRCAPAEGVVFRYMWDADPQPVEAYGEEPVLSDRRMALYRNWFAGQIELDSTVTTHILTIGGSVIPGAVQSSAGKMLEYPSRRDEIDQIIEAVAGPGAEPSPGGRQELEAAIAVRLDRILGDLAELRHIAETAVNICLRIRQAVSRGEDADFSPLQELDQRLQGHPAGQIAGFLVQDALSRINLGHGSASIAEQLDASENLYRGLAESALLHEETLAQAR